MFLLFFISNFVSVHNGRYSFERNDEQSFVGKLFCNNLRWDTWKKFDDWHFDGTYKKSFKGLYIYNDFYLVL